MTWILVVLGVANTQRANGVNTVVDAHARWLTRQGMPCEVWGLTSGRREAITDRPYPVRLFAAGGWSGADPELVQALRQRTPDDLVFIHSAFAPALCRVADACRKLGRRYVCIPHGAYEPAAIARSVASWMRKRAWVALRERRMLDGAQAILALGSSERISISAITTTRIIAVPNGIDPGGKPDVREPRRHQEGLRLLFVGRYDRQHKGLDLLLTGFAGYVRAFPRAVLRLHGEGPDRDWLAEAAARMPPGSCLVGGPLWGEAKLQAMALADVFVHASRWEGMPTACLEAASTGCPLLVSTATNLGEHIQRFDAGLCGPAEELFSLLAHAEPRLPTWSSGAAAMVRDELNWDAVVSRLRAGLEAP